MFVLCVCVTVLNAGNFVDLRVIFIFKERVHTKNEILSSFTDPDVIPNTTFYLLQNTKEDRLKNAGDKTTTEYIGFHCMNTNHRFNSQIIFICVSQ